MDRFKLMETYAAVVEAGSFTRAAKALGVTSAMVSKRIQDLEATLSVKLLNRNTHRLNVTENGASYYDKCVTLLADVHALEESMQGKRRTPQGEVNILSTRTFSETFLAPIIADFCSLYPTISVRITLMDRALAPHPTDLIMGGYDLAIRTLAVKDSSLVARPLIELPQLLVASPEYLARSGAPRTPLDLADHNCLDPAHTGISFTWELHGPSGRTVVRVSGTPRTNSTSIVRHAALRGLGIALLRSDLIAEHLRDGMLEEVLPGQIVRPKKFYVVYQKDRHQPLRIKVFIEFLTKRMKQGAKLKKAASR